MTSIKKWLKLTVLNFWEKFKLSQYGVNGAFLSPKSTLLKFSLNLFIRCFWNYTWWQTLKMSKSGCLNFEETCIFASKMQKHQNFTKSVLWFLPEFYILTGIKMELKWLFLRLSWKLWLYPKNSSLDIFRYKIDMLHISSSVTFCFW